VKNSIRIIAVSGAFVLCGVAVHAAPVIGQTTASNDAFTVGATTQITVTSAIRDPALIAASVTLQRLNADGTFTTIGLLHDDGRDGDVSSGDRLFTLRFSLTATVPTEYRLRVSAAFKGVLKRVFSETFSIYARSTSTPEQMLSQLSSELSIGNIEAALLHFSANPRNREKFAGFTPEMLAALSEGFRTASLLRTAGPTRVYSVRVTRSDGVFITTEIGLTQIASGQWYVMYW
jgi:hypothetical protein